MNSDTEDNNKAQQFLEPLKVAAKQLDLKLFSRKSVTVETATQRNDIRLNPEAIEQYGDKTLSITICCFWSYCSSRTR